MLNFSISRRRQNQQSQQVQPASADRRLSLGLDQRRPRVRKDFGFIFKEELGGVEALHSRSAQAQYLGRYGAWYSTAPALRDWLKRWMRGGGLAVR